MAIITIGIILVVGSCGTLLCMTHSVRIIEFLNSNTFMPWMKKLIAWQPLVVNIAINCSIGLLIDFWAIAMLIYQPYWHAIICAHKYKYDRALVDKVIERMSNESRTSDRTGLV